MKTVLKINGVFRKVEEVILSVCIMVTAAILVANVLARTFFNSSLTFAEELCALLTVILTFVGCSYCARVGIHINMTAIFDILPLKGKKIFEAVICIGTAAAMLFIAYQASLYILNLAQSGRVTPSLNIPLWLGYIFIPFGLLFTAVQYILILILNLQDKEEIHVGVEVLPDEYVDVDNEDDEAVDPEGGNAL